MDAKARFRLYLQRVDWKLLVFLLLLVNVKLVVKLAAILLIYAWRFNFKFGYRLKKSRLTLFYPAVILIALVNFLIYRVPEPNYIFSFLTGLSFWLICILGGHQLKLFIEKNEPEVVNKTLTVFFLINVFVSLSTLALIIFKTGAVNPYTYQGEFQKYFISTGDYIKGASFDTSTTNAVLNAFAVIFFFTKRNFALLFICLITMLLTASNMVNFLLIICFVFLFIFHSDRPQKSIIVVSFLFFIVFLIKISPQNNHYISDSVSKMLNEKATANVVKSNIPITEMPDSLLSIEDTKKKKAKLYLDSVNRIMQAEIEKAAGKKDKETAGALQSWQEKPVVPVANIHTAPYQHKDDPTAHKDLVVFASTHELVTPIVDTKNRLPGKLLALQQTYDLFKSGPKKILTGTGMGNFSSKLAFKTISLGIAGSYPKRLTYLDPGFEKNHLALYLSFFTGQERYHSIINSPNSVYDQVISEYGLIGLVALLFLYFGFFLKHYKLLSYGIPLLIIVSGLFFLDYWFEQLSVIFIFELMLFLNIKEKKHE
jgi:hypothetical protein